MPAIEHTNDTRHWFRERVRHALGEHGLCPDDSTEAYLVELLAAYGQGSADPAELGEPYAQQLARALEAQGPERLRRFRVLGDTALYASGFFAESLERRGVTLDYVCAMGHRGYRAAGRLAAGAPRRRHQGPVFDSLARGFRRFVAVLSDVREETHLATPQDLVRLYERYRRSPSPRIARRLRAQGVFLQAPGRGGWVH